MAGFQFIHIETYSRSMPKKSAGRKATMRQVFAEALREPDACPHIEQPTPPELIYGQELAGLEAEIADAANQAKDARGHKLRQDGAVLLAGVASYPDARAAPGAVAAWEAQTVAFLREEWGDRLRSVIRHTDEAYPHLHFYVTTELRDGRLNLKALHPGHRAAEGLKGSEARKAYIGAMRGFQDRYHEQVGQLCGLTRLGPRKRRLTRAAWQAEKRQAEALARVEDRAQSEVASLASVAAQDRAAAAEELAAAKREREKARTTSKAAKGALEAAVAVAGGILEAAQAEGDQVAQKRSQLAQQREAFEERVKSWVPPVVEKEVVRVEERLIAVPERKGFLGRLIDGADRFNERFDITGAVQEHALRLAESLHAGRIRKFEQEAEELKRETAKQLRHLVGEIAAALGVRSPAVIDLNSEDGGRRIGEWFRLQLDQQAAARAAEAQRPARPKAPVRGRGGIGD